MARMDDIAVAARTGSPAEVRPGTTADRAAAPSFEAFFLRHHLRLFRALWLMTRNRHEAEEVMQDAFLRMWERWDRVSTLPDPVGYLYRTAMNGYRSRLRRAAVAVRRAIHQLPPDDEMAAVEAREDVVRTLASLTPRQRAAVVLVDVLDLSSEQAGEVMGVKAATVRVLAARGRTALEKELGERHDGCA